MKSFKMSWFLILLILSFTFNPSEANNDHEKLPSAAVVGTVYCDTCSQQGFSRTSHFISGATVAVECRDGSSSKPSFWKEAKTNEHGDFKVQLPISVGKSAKKLKDCAVKLISSSETDCAVASSATSSSLRLKSWKEGTHVFSAGYLTFKPLKQPNMCHQNPSRHGSKTLNSRKAVIPEIPAINLSPLPLIPGLPVPLPYLPPLPPLEPDLLFPPLLPPLFPSPPPSIGIPLPPNPFQPPPILPPIPFQPPAPPAFQLPPIIPPIPGFIPPSSPPPPAFPIPLPPIFSPPPGLPGIPGIPPIFSPPPGIPGIPPASSSSSSFSSAEKTSP
ncbi:pollen-specific leucine-rich repeat extensin-like protein 4 [Malania oleifera]|uniref:pollen-specific leucine-rich repeat extensin-like protein 4 n=1 Tax=Malania oleifera TaxID=397392 RepID=UPI0025AE307D|nr:pollen-specific leucine-rich repeat extensin-like protein 4 [Malania oleifera]